MAYDALRNINEVIARMITEGRVIMTIKTKSRDRGGKQVVSVGPYRTACGPRRFAMIGKTEDVITLAAWDAAKAFIAFVGRDHAREAVRAYRRANGI